MFRHLISWCIDLGLRLQGRCGLGRFVRRHNHRSSRVGGIGFGYRRNHRSSRVDGIRFGYRHIHHSSLFQVLALALVERVDDFHLEYRHNHRSNLFLVLVLVQLDLPVFQVLALG